MKTSAALALVATGAILAFAVTAHPSYFNFQVAGWALLLTGAAGLVIPRRSRAGLRRVVRRPRIAPETGEGATIPGPVGERAEETVEEIYEELGKAPCSSGRMPPSQGGGPGSVPGGATQGKAPSSNG